VLRHFRIAREQAPGEDGKKIRRARNKNERSDQVVRTHRDPVRRLFQKQGLCLVQNIRFLEEFSHKNVNEVAGYSEVALFEKIHERF